MDIFEKFIQIFDSLNKGKVEYVLIGGFAVILYGLPRVTEDIDLFIDPDEDNIERLKDALYRVFEDDDINDISADMLKDYAVVRYGTLSGFHIDLIVKIGEIFSYEDLQYDIKEIEGHKIRVATKEILYNMKKDTVRPIDKSDAVFLLELIKKERE